MWGAQEKSEGGGHQKNFGRRFAPAFCPHLQIASDATAVRLFVLFRRILLGTEVRRNFKLGGNVPLARSVFRQSHKVQWSNEFSNRRHIITDKKSVAEMLTVSYNSVTAAIQ